MRLTIRATPPRRFWHLAVPLCLLAAAACAPPQPAPQARSHRVAVVQLGVHPIINMVRDGLEKRLHELFGEDVSITLFNGNFDSSALQQGAIQAIGGNFDAVVPLTTPAAQAVVAVRDGRTPIVFSFVTEPASLGYFGPGSLPKITGLADNVPYDQMLRLIRDVFGRDVTIGYLLTTSEANAITIHAEFAKRAATYGLRLVTANITSTADVQQAASALAGTADAFLVGGDHTVVSAVDALLTVAQAHGKPVFACDRSSIEKGAVAGATVDYGSMGERTAEIVAFVLAGANPERLPVEIFSHFVGYYNKPALRENNLELPARYSETWLNIAPTEK